MVQTRYHRLSYQELDQQWSLSRISTTATTVTMINQALPPPPAPIIKKKEKHVGDVCVHAYIVSTVVSHKYRSQRSQKCCIRILSKQNNPSLYKQQ